MTEKLENLVNTLDGDLVELKDLVANHAKRDNVKLLLNTWIEKITIEKNSALDKLEAQKPKKLEKKEETKVDPTTAALNAIDKTVYETITKFGWDQAKGKVKIYITSGLDGVGSIPKDNVVCEFEDKTLDLKIQ